MSKRIAIYTAIFGGYDALRDPEVVPSDCDFICFTDTPQRSKIWQMRIVSPLMPNDLTRSNRHIKILPHKYLSEYEYSVYVDGTFLVRGNINELCDNYLSQSNMAAFKHGDRNCIYDEAAAIIKECEEGGRCRDNPEVIKKQMAKYKAEGYPAKNSLIGSGVLLRRHNAPDVIKTMELWWKEERVQSKRDQLSFNYAAWKNDFSFTVLPGILKDNPYFHHQRHRPPQSPLRRFVGRVWHYISLR